MTLTSLRLGTAALRSWQEQLLGPPDPKDNGISLDGKELGHARGVQLVSAVTAKGQRWLGTERVDQKSNEIPAALPQKKLLDRLDLRGQLVALGTLHTQTHTVRHLGQERGGDYLCTLKDNRHPAPDRRDAADSAALFPLDPRRRTARASGRRTRAATKPAAPARSR